MIICDRAPDKVIRRPWSKSLWEATTYLQDVATGIVASKFDMWRFFRYRSKAT